MGRTDLPAAVCCLFGLICSCRAASAQTPEEVRQAFVDLHDDKIPRNCMHATDWLFKYREQLKDDLIDEFYKTDLQGRESIFYILANTDSFVPDERFIRFVAGDICQRDSGEVDWALINRHFDQFEPLLIGQITGTRHSPHDMFVLWATTWLMKKHGVLDQHADVFTPAVLDRARDNLKNDEQGFNASQAVRFFLLLGDKSLATLREAASHSDQQGRSLAKATLDALAGKREAFGYLGSKVSLTRTPFGPGVPEPEWYAQAIPKYLDQETYP